MRLEFLYVEHAPCLSTFRTSNGDVQQKDTPTGTSGDLIDMADKGNQFLKIITGNENTVLLVRSANTTAMF